MSTCLGGALVGALLSGWIADGVGRHRAFKLCLYIIALECLLGLYVAIGLVSFILYTFQLDLILVYNRLIVVSDS